MPFDFDVLIIGSGFGGSVAAKRFCQATISPAEGVLGKVAIIEMGERWHNWNGSSYVADTTKLRQSQDMKYIDRLFRDYPDDYATHPSGNNDNSRPPPPLVIAQGMGFGGGSLIYSGIHLRAPTNAFTGWPTGYTRPNLDPFYTRAEGNLGVAADPQTFNYRRPALFKRGAALRGWTANALPLAMTGCVHCGWCVPTCTLDKKMSMPLTYLKAARATGTLTTYTGYKASDIEPMSGGGYRVHMLRSSLRPGKYHLQEEDGDPYWDGSWYALTARKVVIAAGAIESPAILRRSQYWWGLGLHSGTGAGIDGQGDAVTGGFVPATTPTDTYKGAIMMSQVDRGDYVLQDIHGIPAGPTVKYGVSFDSLWDSSNGYKTYGLDYKRKLRDYGTRMLGIAVIGKSPSGANISVSGDWSGNRYNAVVSQSAYQPPTGAMADAASIITALGGEVVKTPWEMRGQIATVHPTGGCKMGTASSSSTVRSTDLQVWGYTGLFVIDGSVLPSNTFRNPSNTILAVAEKAMDVILNVPGKPTW